MHKSWVIVLAACIVSGCGVTVGVIGKAGQDEKLYRGTATGYISGTGTIEIANPTGHKCVGEFRYMTSTTGTGTLRCNDGRSATFEFTALSGVSGYGYGTGSDGTPVRFVFGLPEEEGRAYLSEAPKVSSSGTGFFVSAHGHTLTNFHVVKECDRVTVRFPDGTSEVAEVVATDESNDLAIVLTKTSVQAFARFDKTPSYRQGDQVVVYGFPLADTLASAGSLTTGTLSALSGLRNDSRYLQISAPVQPGNSGGPLADNKGNVIGIVTGKLNAITVAKVTGDIPQNVNFAIKGMVAKTFMQAHGIPYTEARDTAPLSTADVGDVLRRYVVRLRCKAG
jgi:S1-C subfamily serine protease